MYSHEKDAKGESVFELSLSSNKHQSSNIEYIRDKMNCTVMFGNCVFSVPLIYQPCCLVSCCQSKLRDLTKNSLRNLL